MLCLIKIWVQGREEWNVTIDGAALRTMLLGGAERVKAHVEELTEIDSRFGDGDHGFTMQKIALYIEDRAKAWDGADMAGFLDDLGMGIMEIRGGSAGPLYGTLIGGLGAEIGGLAALDGAGAKAMLEGCLAEMEEVTTAGIGDKTMMDALIPAVRAAGASEGAADEVWQAAAAAAEKGAEESRNFVSKYGRARSYKEATIGTPDAGAVSVSLFLRGMADALQ